MSLYRGYASVAMLNDLSSLMVKLERLKVSGNDAFNSKDYEGALHKYSKAIGLVTNTHNIKMKAVLFANRVAALMAMGRSVWLFLARLLACPH